MDAPPPGVWESLTGLFAAAALYLGVLARKEKRSKAPMADHDSLRKAIDEQVEPTRQIAMRNQERLDDLYQADRDKGERLVKLEALGAEFMRRMNDADERARSEREEQMAMLKSIEGKVDGLTRFVYSGGKA